MWFKNLTLFRYPPAGQPNVSQLSEHLAGGCFEPCLPHALAAEGWVAPLGDRATDLVHQIGGHILIALQRQEKILPATVIREAVATRVAQIVEREGRQVFRKERDRLRDEVLHDLVPRAFTRTRTCHAYLDGRAGWLVVDSISPRAVEQLTSALRRALGSLPLQPLRVARAPSLVMTEWLEMERPPTDFALENECELRAGGAEGGVVRCRGQDLLGEELKAHLSAGKQVTRLALSWEGRVGFVLQEDLTLRRLRFLDVVREQLSPHDGQTAEQLHDAQFALMTAELAPVLRRLIEVFGGEQSD